MTLADPNKQAFCNVLKFTTMSNFIIIIIIIINFVNISMSALGIFDTSSDTFLQMLKDLNFNQDLTHHIIMKASNIAIRCTYYIYCRRNKQLTNLDL